jgi:AcrR family transcriptional regulator
MAIQARAPRRQAQRRSESAESLLDAAAESIAERGIEGTSLALIGERAGKSRGLANHHFGTKSTLVERLAQRCQDRLEAASTLAVEQAAGQVGELSALDAVRVMVDTYLERFEHPTADERALIVMWGASFPAHSSVDTMVEADRRAYDGLSEVIAQGQRTGSVSAGVDPRAAAVILLALMRGIAAQQLTESAVIDVERVRAACRDWITAALAPPAPHRDRASA